VRQTAFAVCAQGGWTPPGALYAADVESLQQLPDLLGRQFAVDSGRLEGGEPLVLLFEPGTGEILEIPYPYVRFHEQLDELREPALAGSFFDSWEQANPGLLPLGVTQCAGYRVPLFLGGKDVVDNLEVVDLEVYWALSGQLHKGTCVLPPGTSIGQISQT
jgi:hypothetical protein